MKPALWAGLLCIGVSAARGASADALFRDGVDAYRRGEFARAAKSFDESVRHQPASGTLRNLGNAEWQRGRVGHAVLAWEQVLWLDPSDDGARNNLRFARDMAQLDTPDLTWYETASAWLPSNWWLWIAGVSLWLVAGALTLPGVFRRRKAGWHQALASSGLAVFLLTIPALAGTHTRSRLGFVTQRDTLLRLTPTLESQEVTRVAAGEPVRCERVRGPYVFVRTGRAAGWVEREVLGSICPW